MYGKDYNFGSVELEDEYYDEPENVDPSMYDNMEYPSDDKHYITFSEVFHTCVIPTSLEIAKTYFLALAACLVFQLVNFCPIPKLIRQLISGALGFGMLYYYFGYLTIHCVSLLLIYYFVTSAMLQYKIRLSFTSVLLLAYLTISEFTFEGSTWGRIRNIQMLLVMKMMSLVKDYEGEHIEEFPRFINYFGYMFCVGNCIFGPWIDYKTYSEALEPKKWTVAYAIDFAKSMLSGYLFFIVSTCFIDWMMQGYMQNGIALVYAKGLEFRVGHYFIMCMSSSYILAAFGPLEDTTVTRPNRIEFPHSLVEVVVYWNIPMHNWLKKYIFKPLQAYGNFVAVIGTYFVSSLLHGSNYQLSGILLSLGIYTYAEYNFRRKLANRLNACVSSKQCKPYCDRHRHTERKLSVCFLNLSFSIVALYHLSYLGCLLDLRVDKPLGFYESFDRWKYLDYQSHYIALATFIISLVL